MQVRFTLLGISFCVAGYGCATAPEQAASASPAATNTASAAVPDPKREKGYRTGSRLPQSDDDAGSATVSGSSREGYEEDRRNMVTPQRW
jgi:hypothetical protein